MRNDINILFLIKICKIININSNRIRASIIHTILSYKIIQMDLYYGINNIIIHSL